MILSEKYNIFHRPAMAITAILRPISVFFVVLSIPPIVLMLLYCIFSALFYFFSFPNVLDNTLPPTEWGNYAVFLSFSFQAVIGIATLGAALLIPTVIGEANDRRRAEEERAQKELSVRSERFQKLLGLSEKMVDTVFYREVTYPAWIVALKWLTLEGDEGDAYRAALLSWEMEMPVEHYASYIKKPEVLDEKLSEFMVITIWLRFWCHVNLIFEESDQSTMVEFKKSEKNEIKLLKEWYRWWSPFFVEYAYVVLAIAKETNNSIDSYSAVAQLLKLEEKMGINFEPSVSKKFNERISYIVEATKKQHEFMFKKDAKELTLWNRYVD